MGKTILSAVLAGMFAPTVYRQGAYGPQVDSLATAGAAYNAGQGVIAKQNAAAQAQSDLEVKNKADSQSRMLGVAKSNVEMMHLYAATMADMGKSAQNQVDNFAPTLQIAKDHDEHLQPGDTKAVLGSGYTMDEALKHPEFKGAMLKHSIIPDGIVYIDDDQGHQIPTQTWTIIDPNVKVSLDAPSVAIVSQINPQWKDAFDATNGNMQIQLGKIQQVTQQVNSVQHAERLFTDAANSDDKMIQGLGLKGDINGEIMSAVRQGTPGARQALQALMAMENAGASQGTLADALNRLITDKDHAAGARYVLDALGTTPEKAEKYIREDQLKRKREDAEATADVKEQAKIESVASDNDAKAVLANPKKYSADIVAAAQKWVENDTNAEVNKEQRKVQNAETLSAAKQDDKDKRQMVYAEDPKTGSLMYVSQYDADHVLHASPSTIREVDKKMVAADTSALRMLNDVQANVSRYTKAATDYSQAQLTYRGQPVSAQHPVPDTTLGIPTGSITDSNALRQRDNAHLNTLLNKAGIADINAAISAGGHIEVPVLSSFGERLTRGINSKDYNELSDQGKALYDGYIRTMAAVPAYQKALTGIGRSNKEMLDLELANIANPTMAPQDILRKQTAFQENVNRASEGFPKLPGVPHPSDLRNTMEQNQPQPTPQQKPQAPPRQPASDINMFYNPKTRTVQPMPNGGQ